jgi:hypothetical protein
MGQSAGASLAHMLEFSPAAQGQQFGFIFSEDLPHNFFLLEAQLLIMPPFLET